MSHFRAFATGLCLAVVMAIPASAQQRGGGMGMMGGAGALLTNTGVQKELKLEESQISKITVLADEVRTMQRDSMQGFQDMTPEERRSKGAEVTLKVNTKVDKALAEICKEEQVKRFKQIRHQVGGPQAFTDPEVATALKITDEQKGKIREIMSGMQSQQMEIFQTAQDDREGAMKKMNDLRKTTKDKIVALMSDEQKKSWEGLVGAPFEYVPTPPPAR